eukprot:TRINITY_DN102769_c0_g1_i1.p1 TRINITY_DN102769_c0_g1~~TRINITY_DN102769_c0_g1_i1.p1  ORF type:complete len:141 (+),score=37.56 TRINITY_DN102769_c0_g1_i1:87-509(+)
MSGGAGLRGWKGLSFPQKLIYSSAMVNLAVISFVWVKRQIKLAEKEKKEVEEMQTMANNVSAADWGATSEFRCFYAAQHYHILNSSGPEEETGKDVQKMLEVLALCREELYKKMPPETPSMKPLHIAPALPGLPATPVVE